MQVENATATSSAATLRGGDSITRVERSGIAEARASHNAEALERYLDQALGWLRQLPLNRLGAQAVERFVRAVPKVDLHCHLEGAIAPEVLIAVAKRHDVKLPAYDVEALRPYVQITPEDKTLLDFLKKFDTIGAVFTSREVIEELTAGVVADANKDGVEHLELRFSPMYMAQAHDLPLGEVIDGVVRGVERATREGSTTVSLTLIVERQMGVEPAKLVLELAERHREHGVVAVDLANDEYNYPPGPYAQVFQAAKKAGLNVTIHAGEAGGANNVRTSIEELGADRIGHGVRTREDADVLELVRSRQTPLELCLTSNVQTGAVASLQDHPLREYLDAGLAVTLNTDDPAVSGITLGDDLRSAIDVFDVTLGEARRMLDTAVRGAFLTVPKRDALRQRVDGKWRRAEAALLEELSLGELHRLAVGSIKASAADSTEKAAAQEALANSLAAVVASSSRD